MRIYTKTGDNGQTSLYDGSRIDKDSMRVEAYGTLDELNSYIGLCTNYVKEEDKHVLLEIQKYLFLVSAQLATKDEKMISKKVTEEDVNKLESIIDEYINKTDNVNAFIVPGTSLASANLHIARTICRRAERRILSLNRVENISSILIKYINRLSDTLYAIARYNEKELILIDF
ncbi:cob(I)yrinic acid a,c-diamide adenosyltransferase [Romboutsia weinsteinii]|uniref:Corrinoid adenosyltransferase n=1 Tax=Romboutsia weinsteinii TaxID=2020949 RepID=A0A371J5G8_9FIRM|nr:cob(I)yrinic acid a,c-diamide adenosyltransferase [Romboutsia weinsteinii]RDY27928.1 cob(I)yrinic acid a,c-diamide adenosyltransferase [Romboutsia weinsteinii]